MYGYTIVYPCVHGTQSHGKHAIDRILAVCLIIEVAGMLLPVLLQYYNAHINVMPHLPHPRDMWG